MPQGTAAGDKTFQAFSGSGFRLDGKGKGSNASLASTVSSEKNIFPIVVDTEYVPGKLTFVR